MERPRYQKRGNSSGHNAMNGKSVEVGSMWSPKDSVNLRERLLYFSARRPRLLIEELRGNYQVSKLLEEALMLAFGYTRLEG